MPRTLFSLVTLAVVLSANVGHADNAADSAAWKKRGDDAMDALRYEEAIADYSRALAASQDPAILYNRGRVYQARSEYTLALADLEKFERDANATLKSRVPKLAELIEELRGHVATLTVHVNVDGAEVKLRHQSLGKSPIDSRRVNAGPAVLEITSDGYLPYRSESELPGRSSPIFEVKLEKATASSVLVVREPGSVLIDGNVSGDGPVEVSVPAGSHRVVLRRSGAPDLEKDVSIAPGERREVPFDSDEHSGGIASKWWFWTGLGVVVVAAASVTAVALTHEKPAATGDSFQPSQVTAAHLRF